MNKKGEEKMEQVLENNLNKNLENINELNIAREQQNFLDTNIGQAINEGLNFGLRAVLPDFMEEEVIKAKDALITGGFKEAANTAVENAINIGKSFLGIFTGKFENISQIKTAIQKGGLIDGISDALDFAIDWAKKQKYISSSTAKLIKKGKKEILKSIKNGVDNSLENQVEAIEKINGYIDKWKNYYEKQDFTNMEYQYKKIQEYMEQVVPLEDTINKAREVETMHTLIKNNGKNFQLSDEEKELIKLLK